MRKLVWMWVCCELFGRKMNDRWMILMYNDDVVYYVWFVSEKDYYLKGYLKGGCIFEGGY